MFGLFGGKKKKEFMSDNSKAYFHIYCAKNITVDNQNFSELEHIKGDDLEDGKLTLRKVYEDNNLIEN